MSDLISRQAVIRWVKTECNPYGKPTLDFESGKRVMKHLEQMPSAQPEQRWIPCSERLPEEGQNCLVCDKGSIGIDTYIGHGNPYNWKWYVRDYEAWMPLPKPCKEGDTT